MPISGRSSSPPACSSYAASTSFLHSLLAARLRAGDPPVVGWIQEGKLLLDARTVLPGEDEALIEAVVKALGCID